MTIIMICILLLTGCDSIIKQDRQKRPMPQQTESENKDTTHNTTESPATTGATDGTSGPPGTAQPPANPPADNNQPGNGTQPSQPPSGAATQPIQPDPAVIAEAFPPEILVSKIEVLGPDSNPLPKKDDNDPTSPYDLNLYTGDEYQIITRVTPENAQDKTLTYFVEEKYRKHIEISETGLLTIKEKPPVNNRPYIDIKSSNGVVVQIRLEVTQDISSIITGWELQSTDTNTEIVNNTITVTGGQNGAATLKIIKANKNSKYEAPFISDKENVHVEKTTIDETTDQYTITIDKNKTAWEKVSDIRFYTIDNSGTKPKQVTLKTVKIVQKPNLTFKKTIQWVHGITPPPADKLYTKPFKYDTWGEDAGTDWFYARKRSYTGEGGFPDSQLCWAMTTANMLHWWFTQNETNIKKYMAKKGIQSGNDVYDFYTNKYDKNALEKDKSSFANKMREYAKNSGSLTQIGLQWYLEGRDSEYFKSKAPKLFSDVLSSGGDNSIATRAYLNNKNDVNTFFKEAIQNKEAIAVSYEEAGYPVGHVVTVWGISLDEEENVIELWVADSDLASHIAKPIVYNMGIAYNEGGFPMWYNTAVEGQSTKRFSLITRLGLGQDKFKAFLGE